MRILIFLICILIVFVFYTGCTQENAVAGEYQNEAYAYQYITFGDGTFSHIHYNNTPEIKTGTFKVNNTIITLFYQDGKAIEYYISNLELIPVNENSSLPDMIKMENRFVKPVKMQQ
jgi:hypothetical protein